MTWSVKYDPVTKIAELTYTGRITREELIASVAERIRVQKQHGTILTLTDASQIEYLDVDILDIHDLPAKLYDSAEVNRATRLALLPPHPKDAREIARHYVNACLNRGWIVQTFEDRQNAIEWLMKNDSFSDEDEYDGATNI